MDGMDTVREETLLQIRKTVGMVFQNPDNQIVANVVEEDVAFAPENLGVPPELNGQVHAVEDGFGGVLSLVGGVGELELLGLNDGLIHIDLPL